MPFDLKRFLPKMNASDEAKLSIKISNIAPVELLDLTESMNALGKQYVRFLNKNNVKVNQQARLYVKELRTGSLIIELQDLLPTSVLFAQAENFNHIIDFVKNIKEVYQYFLGEGGEPKETLVEADLNNYSSIINPIVKDKGSQINISGDYNNKTVINYNLSFDTANIAQNQIDRLLSQTKESVTGVHHKVAFYWNTIKKKSGATGENGIIESISSKPIRVIFDDESLKQEMAFMENANPMLIGFIVDVHVDTIQTKPVVYKILKIHGVVSK